MWAVVTNFKGSKPDLQKLFSGPVLVNILYKVNEDGKRIDTNSTLIIGPESVIRDSKIEYRPYDFKRFSSPNPDHNQSWNIHISGFPNSWTRHEAISYLKEYLDPVFPSGWRAHFNIDRETGRILGFGVIRFKENMTETDICQIKLALHHKKITNGVHLRVTWQMETDRIKQKYLVHE